MSWLDDLHAAADKERAKRPRPAVGEVTGDGTTSRYGAKALANTIADLTQATVGERNKDLNNAALKLGHIIAAGHLNEAEAIDALTACALSIGLGEQETRGTIRSGLSKGKEEPQDIPPLIQDLSPIHLDALAPPTTGEPAEDDLPVPIDWHELWADDTEDEWLLEPLIPARRLVALFSAPKVGKSLLMLELAAAVAAGKPVLGHDASPPQRVLYVDYENDPRGDIRDRLQSMDYKPEDLDELRYLSYPVLGGLDTYPGAQRLIRVCDKEKPVLVVIDTLSRSVTGEENSNDTWLNFYKLSGLALKQRGIAAVRLDHSGKDENKGMRGGSAKYGDVDVVWQLKHLVDNTYTLHSDHHRMVLSEDTITLTRHDNPLRHAVAGSAKTAAWLAQVEHATKLLDELGIDPKAGEPTVKKALKEAGKHVSRAPLRKAIKDRQSKVNIWQEPTL